MHEMSLAQSIVDLVEDQARRDSFTRTRTIRLSIGVLSHVEPSALEFGFEVVARGTIAEGAGLTIERPMGRAVCTDCGKTVSVSTRGDACPECASYRWLLVDGDQMRVVELEVE